MTVLLPAREIKKPQVARVDVKSNHIVVRLAITSEQQSGQKVETDVLNHDDDRDRSQHHIGVLQTDASINVLTVPWKPARRPREIIPPAPVSPRPDIAAQQNCTVRQVIGTGPAKTMRGLSLMWHDHDAGR
jgi:hypothetical protein